MAKFFLRGIPILSITFLCLACGVKGDPLPPDKPPFIGHGHTDFKNAFATDKTHAPTSLAGVVTAAPAAKATVKGVNKKEKDNDEDSDKNEDESEE